MTARHEQRYHDALQEAMRRLIAAGLVPEQGGQPVKVWAHISLADLMQLEGSAALVQEWAERLRARWAGHRAAAAEAGGHQGLWLDGDAAQGIACDAPVTPVVVGDVNPAAFGDLVRLCAQLDKLRQGPGHRAGRGPARRRPARRDQPGKARPGAGRRSGRPAVPGSAGAGHHRPGRRAALRAGRPGQFLRRKLLDVRLPGPACRWTSGTARPSRPRSATRSGSATGTASGPAGCSQPAAACQVHHTKHKADGGKTSLTGCVLLCRYHHQVMIHRRGWTLVVNPDGTTTAWNKDKTKVLHSHGPPARAG